MKRSQHSYTVPATADRVAEVLLTEGFHVELGDSRADVESTEFRWVDEGRVFELHQAQYGRTRTGALDRSRRTSSVTRYRWGADSHRLGWQWSGEDERVSVSGGVFIEPEGPGTRITAWRLIEVRMPLIGGRVERIIDREFEASDVKYQAIMRRHLGL